MSYVYEPTGGGYDEWTVGFYRPEQQSHFGGWVEDSVVIGRDVAAARCNWLNGGSGALPRSVPVEHDPKDVFVTPARPMALRADPEE